MLMKWNVDTIALSAMLSSNQPATVQFFDYKQTISKLLSQINIKMDFSISKSISQ